jgi:RNA polymerase sigma-70 factor (ECF subfamily)
MAAWESMPPHKPDVLSAFLGKLTRRIAIDKWRRRSADKRGGGTVAIALEELSACLPSGVDLEKEVEAKELACYINTFLDAISPVERNVFVMRYFYLASTSDICGRFAMSESKLKSMLYRIRKKLRTYLERRGYI